MDMVIRLLQDIRQGVILKQPTALICFDAGKAYDHVNPSLLLLKLQRKGVNGLIMVMLRKIKYCVKYG